MKLKIGFVKREENGGAIGVRYVLEKNTTIKSVRELRKHYAGIGWKETPRTRKYTDREIARLAATQDR